MKTWIYTTIIIGTTVAIGLPACQKLANSLPPTPPQMPNMKIYTMLNPNSVAVVFTTEDGTRCVALLGSGLSCDWSQR